MTVPTSALLLAMRDAAPNDSFELTNISRLRRLLFAAQVNR
jgi:hypothetical protein